MGDFVKLLLDNGADVNAQNAFNFTAMILASLNNNKDMVKLLINNGGDVKAVTCYDSANFELKKSNDSSRGFYSPTGREEIYNNKLPYQCATALSLAVYNNNTDIVSILTARSLPGVYRLLD